MHASIEQSLLAYYCLVAAYIDITQCVNWLTCCSFQLSTHAATVLCISSRHTLLCLIGPIQLGQPSMHL